ncbi:unnamed protein product [Peniophora sp. CBMAI 1063]|nr:unnamed protein product [Peniophora sp. CBMAI 1063]
MPDASAASTSRKKSSSKRTTKKPDTKSKKALPPVPAVPIAEDPPREPALFSDNDVTPLPVPPSPQLSQLTSSLNLMSLPGPLSKQLPTPCAPPAPPPKDLKQKNVARLTEDRGADKAWSLLQKPQILYDSGTGPRVRDVRAFMSSSFAQPPWLADPLCAEFAMPEVLQMLQTVLPPDTAMILWYNKSRKTSRVCPACQRVYSLGDTLKSPVGRDGQKAPEADKDKPISPQLLQEQILSGLCSPICFLMASFHHPDAIQTVWGRMAETIDDKTWAALDAIPPSTNNNGHGLAMLLKMTRLEDLGLSQLLEPDVLPEEYIDQLPPPEEKDGEFGTRLTRVHTVKS